MGKKQPKRPIFLKNHSEKMIFSFQSLLESHTDTLPYLSRGLQRPCVAPSSKKMSKNTKKWAKNSQKGPFFEKITLQKQFFHSATPGISGRYFALLDQWALESLSSSIQYENVKKRQKMGKKQPKRLVFFKKFTRKNNFFL